MIIRKILPLAFVFYATTIFGDQEEAPRSWYLSHENESITNEPMSIDDNPSKSFSQKVDDIFATQGKTFDQIFDQQNESYFGSSSSNWKLTGISMDLALTASGKIGILGTKGKIAVETHWYRKEKKHNESLKPQDPLSEDNTLEESPNAQFSNHSSMEDINREVDRLTHIAYNSGKVKDKKSLRNELYKVVSETHQLVSLVPKTPRSSWEAYKFRLTVFADIKGHVHGSFSAGGDIRLRLDWSIKPPLNSKRAFYRVPTKKEQTQARTMQSLVYSMADDLAVFVDEEKHVDTKFRAEIIVVIVGMTTSGTIGVAKGKSGVKGHLFFRRQQPKQNELHQASPSQHAQDYIYLLGDTDHQQLEKFNSDSLDDLKKKREQIAHKIKRSKIRSGLKKAFKIGQFFAKRAQDSKHKHWALKKFRTDFAISYSGGIGMVTLAGTTAAHVMWVDKNW